MTEQVVDAHPPIHRGSMVPQPWAGHPLMRPLRRLLGYRAPASQTGVDVAQPMMLRRAALLILVVIGAIAGTNTMLDVLPQHGQSWAEQGLLLLFGVLFAWISAGFWTGLMGAYVMLRGRDGNAITHTLDDAPATIADGARTAIIMPICNEHVPTVFAGLRATYESLAATGQIDRFEFFVLSDTGQPDIRAAEQAAFGELAEALSANGQPVRVHYRWRQHRTKRKTGNVSDFLRRWGKDYRYMVVLDADSVMTGDCLTSLARLMEANPDAGIIQTAPRACGHDTVHARVQQFGSRVYGPLFTAGMHFWQLGESHYWGHNAILRVAPFMAHCALARLPGQTSLSGDVMSHDFVEAALMRRAGWKVWIAYDLDGSYEQVPPNLLAEVQRDRRWCHGNLQNSRLIFEPGLHPVHRTVFLTGVLAYISAPLWLAFLVVSTLLFASQVHEVPKYFIEPYQLFPIWPTANLQLMLTLFGLTAVLLLAPKLLTLIVIALRGHARHFGGLAKLLTGALLEFVHSLLLAPVRMLFHSQFVLAALTGWKLEWKSPPRADSSTGWGEAFRRQGLHAVLAAVWLGAILFSGAAFPWWLSPVLIGMIAGIPLSTWGSRSAPGRWLRDHGVFLIPEEVSEPHVLGEARRYAEGFDDSVRFADVVSGADVHRQVSTATASHAPAIGAKAFARSALVAQAVADGPQALSVSQRHRLLSDRFALQALYERVQLQQAHPAWWNAPEQREAQAARQHSADAHAVTATAAA